MRVSVRRVDGWRIVVMSASQRGHKCGCVVLIGVCRRISLSHKSTIPINRTRTSSRTILQHCTAMFDQNLIVFRFWPLVVDFLVYQPHSNRLQLPQDCSIYYICPYQKIVWMIPRVRPLSIKSHHRNSDCFTQESENQLRGRFVMVSQDKSIC